MRGLVAFVGGALTVLAANFLVPAMGLDFAKGYRPDAARELMTQRVDRTHKGDRLDVVKSIIIRRSVPAPQHLLHGCEPAFSPLTSATDNFARRCIT